jgi:6-phosphofructokinase 1
MPDEFIDAAGTGVTDAFRMYLRPLLGSGMPEAYRLRLNPVDRVLASGRNLRQAHGARR